MIRLGAIDFRLQKKMVYFAINTIWFKSIKWFLASNKPNIVLTWSVKSGSVSIPHLRNQLEISFQKALEDWQNTKRCSGVSSSLPQKVHKGDSTSLSLLNFALVNKILFKILYWKSLVYVSNVTWKKFIACPSNTSSESGSISLNLDCAVGISRMSDTCASYNFLVFISDTETFAEFSTNVNSRGSKGGVCEDVLDFSSFFQLIGIASINPCQKRKFLD